MRNTTRCARGRGEARASATLAILTAISLTACSKEQSSKRPTASSQPTTSTIVRTGWGASEGQLGRNLQEEGLPEGPKSFFADAAGVLHVLDQENGRIQKFSQGKPAGTADLPPRPFDDIEPHGSGYAVLDVHSTPAIVFLDAKGLPTSEVSLEGSELPEPSLITALHRFDDGFYVEVTDDYLVRVTDQSGAAVEQTVIPGQALAGSAAFKIAASDSTHLSLFQMTLPDGQPTDLGSLAFDEQVGARTLFAREPSGGMLVAVRTSGEQSDPESPAAESHVLVVLGANGNEKHRVALPAGDGMTDAFRHVKRGLDGNVYVLNATDSGAEIVKVTP